MVAIQIQGLHLMRLIMTNNPFQTFAEWLSEAIAQLIIALMGG